MDLKNGEIIYIKKDKTIFVKAKSGIVCINSVKLEGKQVSRGQTMIQQLNCRTGDIFESKVVQPF